MMEQTYPTPEITPVFGLFFIAIYVLIVLVALAISILIYCKLASKAGYHWATGLLAFVPIANIVVTLIYIFGKWPIQQELELLRRNQAGGSPVPLDNPPPVRDFRNV